MDVNYVIADGSNIAYFRKNSKGKAKFCNLEIAWKELEILGQRYQFSYEIVTDAPLRYNIDNSQKLEEFYRTGKFIQCPNKLKADEFILDFYSNYPRNTVILSNDNFKEYEILHDNEFSICQYIILFDQLIVPQFRQLFLKEIVTVDSIGEDVKNFAS